MAPLGQTIAVIDKSGKVVSTVSIMQGPLVPSLFCLYAIVGPASLILIRSL
jgi:hypothetical protein